MISAVFSATAHSLERESDLLITRCDSIVSPAFAFVHQPNAVWLHENSRSGIAIALIGAKILIMGSAEMRLHQPMHKNNLIFWFAP